MTDPRAGSLKSGGVPLRLRCIVVALFSIWRRKRPKAEDFD